MVKGLMEGKVQKIATAKEVTDHFKEGLTLEVKVEDGKLVIGNTSMTKELWKKIKSEKDADLEVPYKITVLIGEDKKTDKVAKIAFYEDKAVLEDLSK